MGATLQQILSTDCLGSFIGIEGIELKVYQRGWAAGTALEDVLSGAAIGTYAIATQDGRGANFEEWASAAEMCGEEIYYEHYTEAGRVGHGWVDRESRKLVQSG